MNCFRKHIYLPYTCVVCIFVFGLRAADARSWTLFGNGFVNAVVSFTEVCAESHGHQALAPRYRVEYCGLVD